MPSRMNRGVPPCVSAHARTQSSHFVQVFRSMSSTLSPWISPVSMAACSDSTAAGLPTAKPRSLSRATTGVPQLRLDRAGCAWSARRNSSAADAHQLHVLERAERERPWLIEQQADLSGVVSLAQIGHRELASFS